MQAKETNHTQGRLSWRVLPNNRQCLIGCGAINVAYTPGDCVTDRANARRIAAAWNAAADAGLSTEALESGAVKDLVEVLKRCEGTLAAKFAAINEGIEKTQGSVTPMLRLIRDARAAIAKAEGADSNAQA